MTESHDPRTATRRTTALALAFALLAGMVISACTGGSGASNGGFDQAGPSGGTEAPMETPAGY